MDAKISTNEYAPFYAGYIEKSEGVAILNGLKEGLISTKTFFESFPLEKLLYRYAEGKWTPKEILLHLIDSERVFAYRALLISRSENAQIQGFDQDEFVKNSNANLHDIKDLIDEFVNVRKATISLFSSFKAETLLKMGIANNSKVSVRAVGKIIIGHEIHHLEVLNDKYL